MALVFRTITPESTLKHFETLVQRFEVLQYWQRIGGFLGFEQQVEPRNFSSFEPQIDRISRCAAKVSGNSFFGISNITLVQVQSAS